MARRVITVLVAFGLAGLLCSTLSPARQADLSGEVARAVLRHEKLLSDARFEIPTGLYHYYLRDLRNPERLKFDSPIPYIAEAGTYHLTVKADSASTLEARVRLRVFDPVKCLNLPIFGTKNVIWKDLATGDKDAKLTITKGWVRFSATEPGTYTITGRFGSTGAIGLDVIRTVRTAVVFDSPGAWEVRAGSQVAGRFVGTAEKGTHGLLALKPTNRLSINYTRPMPRRARPPRYSLHGDVAWNLGAAAQQVTATLKATIASGASDRIVLLLPGGADRVKITGPEVRRVQVSGGRAVVNLRGKILGPTILNVSLERPAGAGNRLGRFGVEGGRWTGGTLIVTNSAGGSEILPASMTGLRQMSLTEVPVSARAILSAPVVLAYEITSRDFSAEVEVLRLGEFALRESIADLAHYEVFLAGDGAVICRVRYEIRNSNKQFLRLRLPSDAQVLLARVNEKSCPISPRTTGVPPVKKENTGETPVVHSEWLLPLERSRASVMGLVSFPVDVVFMCRTGKLAYEGVAEIPLPGIDLPIAYAWCETYVPPGMEVKKWSGVLKKVARFSSETATASLDYGWGEMAEGYSKDDRPTVKPKPTTTPQPTTTQPIPGKPSTVSRLVADSSAISSLARNYYRAGKDYYDKNEFAESAKYLEQVVKLAPGSTEADNARRLLANPQMPKARKLKGKAEKAAGRGIERRLEEQRRPMERRQEKLLAEALEATRAGKEAEAKAKLATVHILHEKLIAQHADVYKQRALMQQAQPGMKRLRRQSASKIAELRDEVSELKKSGKYEKALKAASELRRYSSELTVVDASDKEDSRAARLKRVEREKLQKEIAELAASASRERQKRTKGKGKRYRIVKAPVATTRPQRRSAGSGGGGGAGAITRLDRTRRIRMQQQDARQRTEIDRLRTPRDDWGRLPHRGKMTPQKREKIAALKARTEALCNEYKYKQAIEVCDKILKLAPDDAWAKKSYRLLDRFVQILDAKDAHRTSMREEIKQLNNIRWSKVTWHVLMNYPGKWPAITLRRKPISAGQTTESEADSAVRRRLNTVLPKLELPGVEFKDVVQFLREFGNVSIHVRWAALEMVGVTRKSKVNVHLTNVTLNKAIRVILDDVGGGNPLGFVLDEGVITISTMDDLSRRTVTRVYDIRDLVVRMPNFKGPNINLRRSGNNNNNAGGWGWGDDDDDDDDDEKTRDEMIEDVLDLIRSTIDPDTWRKTGGKHGSIREVGGQIIITQTAENQRALTDLLSQLRQARGPQVEEGKKIAQQKASEPLTGARLRDTDGYLRQWHGGRQVQIKDRALDEFIRRNYDWALQGRTRGDLKTTITVPDGGTLMLGGQRVSSRELISKLRYNLDQKVAVHSLNVNADARATAALGVRFRRGSNNVNWAVINEAQFRALVELEAESSRRSGSVAETNARLQETIVGTDARLSNEMFANLSYAGDKGNVLDISGNAINLAHEGYLLLYAGGHLTVVQAGAMQHWRETPASVGFVEVPQNIEVPRVGRLFRFERTLLKPSDKMVIRAEYQQKGASR